MCLLIIINLKCGKKLELGDMSTYFSSPPTLSLWCVELGPQVRPFFLLVVRSSFLHTALRPHVLLPSLGVTRQENDEPYCMYHILLYVEGKLFKHVQKTDLTLRFKTIISSSANR